MIVSSGNKKCTISGLSLLCLTLFPCPLEHEPHQVLHIRNRANVSNIAVQFASFISVVLYSDCNKTSNDGDTYHLYE